MKKSNFSVYFLSIILLISMSTGIASAYTALSPVESASWDVLVHRFVKEAEPSRLSFISPEERSIIHSNVDSLTGDINKQDSLIGGIATAISYGSITRGGEAPTTYPFSMPSDTFNDDEGVRKSAVFAWAKRLSRTLGFPVIVQRQSDKYVYAEFGDPDAPEMVMAFSHLDSPTSSVTSKQLSRWRGPDGKTGAESSYYPNQYKSPYIKDGWLYGIGVQDDCGPTIATLFAAKALMDAGLPLDRRIRIVMAGYEDGDPKIPTVANTLKFMNIPYYTRNPIFYDNWAYKSLNREEMPIAAFTADSRFPMIIGNSVNVNRTVSMSLASDSKKAFRLLSGSFSLTERPGDETLSNIVQGAATMIASKAVFTIDISRVSPASADYFKRDLKNAAAARGWAGKTDISESLDSPRRLVLTINTESAMEYPSHYNNNAIVWGMSLLSEALGAARIKSGDLQLKKAAEGITDLFFRNGVEDYIGTYMGIPPSLLRNLDNDCPNLTFAFGVIGGRRIAPVANFYNPGTGIFSVTIYTSSMHINSTKYNAASVAVTNAWQSKGFSITDAPDFRNPALYLSHNNPLTALKMASYKASISSDPAAFDGPYALLDISYPKGGVGGTLAADFFNKMSAFGAAFPSEESWWHAPNERMKVKSIVQMTKVFADGLLEMARYSGPAGARIMWADISGLNPDRADTDLLDVTIGTYRDARGTVLPEHLGGAGIKLLAATSFDIPMFRRRGNFQLSDLQIAAGHDPNYPGITKGTQIYLDPSTIPSSKTYVLPMRLEFKIMKPDGISDAQWISFLACDINEIAHLFTFNILNGNNVIPLALPAGERADMFYYKRVSKYDPDTLYISVNIAIKDDADTNVSTVIAESKTDLYSLSSSYKEPDPFPERSVKEKRGFFVFGDGNKNARFTSPNAIFVTLSDIN